MPRNETMNNNQEYYDFLDTLAERKMSGEVTLYFNNGVIESARTSKRYTKNELRARMDTRKKVRTIVKK